MIRKPGCQDLCVVILIFFLSGCAAAQTPLPPTSTPLPPTPTPTPEPTPIVYNAVFTIEDEGGNPLAGAKILQDGTVIATADDQGSWLVNDGLPEMTFNVWAQGYSMQEVNAVLQPGDNQIAVAMQPDPFGMQTADLVNEGYELVFVEDFQDGIIDCELNGTAEITSDESNAGNQVLLFDMRASDLEFVSCSFGPTGVQDAIIEVDYYYPEIRYDDFVVNDYYNWQGVYVKLRDTFDVEVYPIRVPWGSGVEVAEYSEDWTVEEFSLINFAEQQWYRITSVYNGEELYVNQDGVALFTYAPASLETSGDPAFVGVFGKGYVMIDNIKMWVPAQ